MDLKLITSTANPLVKRIRALEHRKYREEKHAFFVEGIRPVWQAVESGADIEALIVTPELITSEPARQMIEAQGAKGTNVVQITPKVFKSIAQRDHPSGLGAIVRTLPCALEKLEVTPDSLFVALQETGNPGNLGTIIRTMDAVVGSGVILIGDSTDPYHPAAVRASMGSLFSVPIVQVRELDEVLGWCRSRQIKVIAASSRAPMSYWSVEYSLPLLFLFGSEGEGLADETIARGDVAVRIPMAGTADSLNLAVSVGVLLFEVKRQRLGMKSEL